MMKEPLTIRCILQMMQSKKITRQEGLQLLKGLKKEPEQKVNHQPATSVLDDTASATGNSQSIAIIGISGKFPDARDVNEYWDNLSQGKDSVREIPESRWHLDGFYDADAKAPNRSYSKWGGFLSGIDQFDPLFFNISPREAELMDPQQRLFLEEAWQALEDAAYSPQQLENEKCGVFVGCWGGDYKTQLTENNVLPDIYSFAGNAAPILAARISYCLNLKGPSIAVDTACSASLVAIHLACESILSGTSTLALAGGVTILTTKEYHIQASKSSMLSDDGKCHTFDNHANGFVPSEGVGVVVLKALAAAERDGDHIYGVIKGFGINQDGKTNGITAPSAPSQTALECEVYDRYNIHPDTISYVEAHGTGTQLGDPIEMQALTDAFREYTDQRQYCAIGSVKTNIGHAQLAAGMASLIKVLLCLKHKKLVPSLHFVAENEHINFKDSPFYVNTEFKDWATKPNIPRRAAISAFGFSGTNAHLVIEEYQNLSVSASLSSRDPQLIVLSAKNKIQLQVYAKKIIDFLTAVQTTEKNVSVPMPTAAINETYPLIEQDLVKLASDILQVDANDISLDDAFSEYGFDTVSLTTLIAQLNDKYPIAITSALLVEQACLGALARYLFDHLQAQSGKPSGLQAHSLSFGSLADMAYTLQVGRESMDERLAVVVDSFDGIKSKLTQYVQANTEIDDFYQNNVKTASAQAERLIEDEKKDARTLHQLAQRWVAGLAINWALLYPNQKPRRISLPTYPFARKRYWVPLIESKPEVLKAKTEEGLVAKLHPLLGSNTSTLSQQKFTTQLTGEEFYLTDHVVGEQKTLPGVAYLEMARAAFALAGEQPVMKLSHIVWARPIIVADQPLPVQISLSPVGEQVEFEVSTTDDNNHQQVHAQGKLTPLSSSQVSPNNSNTIDIAAVQNRCVDILDGVECYQLFRATSLNYGPRFQTIQVLYRNDREALSRLQLPAILSDDADDFVLHPSLMDGALQTVTGFMGQSTDTTPYLPFALDEVELLGPLSAICYAYVRYVDGSPTAGNTVKKFNVSILNEMGQEQVRLKNLSARAFLQKTDTLDTMYYHNVWESSQRDVQAKPFVAMNATGMVLLFDTDDQRHVNFKARLNNQVILVMPGESYQVLTADSYAINPGNQADYQQLLTALTSHYAELPSRIIHLWSPTEAALNTQLERGFFSLFYLSQALVMHQPSQPIQLQYVYLETDEARQPQYAAVSGFAKTMGLENAKLHYKTVSLADFDKTSDYVVDSVLNEFDTSEPEVRYEAGQRWVKRLQEFSPDTVISTETPLTNIFKENGVYLITGGAGGLGLIFAEYLAKQVKAKLVLTGRSVLNVEQKNKIQLLNSLGADVVYHQADVSQRDEVAALIAQAKAQFNEINGIIHSAGVIKDALLHNKTSEEMSAVLAPKVYGTVYLDEATKNEPLDFFVMFSSIVAVMGNVGQCDYAYANAFMDNFAAQREKRRAAQQRFGKTLSINWSLWKNGGMNIDQQTEKWITNTIGIQALSTETGLAAFRYGLGYDETSQFMVLEGQRSKLRKKLKLEREIVVSSSAPINVMESTIPAENSQWLDKLEQDILTMAGAILKISVNDIDPLDDISEYGFDSISFTEFANQINETYPLEITPTVFFEYPSVRVFCQFLGDEYSEPLFAYYRERLNLVATTSADSTADLADLPEQPVIKLKSRFIESEKRSDQPRSLANTPIAIIGMSGVMPQSVDLDHFWQHLAAGDDLITEVPGERWDWQAYYGDPTTEVNKTKAKWGGFMPAVDQFDPLFFGISPREAELMDPQHRLFLQTVWKTIEDAGYKASDLSGSKTALFVGVSTHDYETIVRDNMPDIEAHSSTGMAYSMLANRISYLLNLHGPSEPIDTACSSALVAIHRAVGAIRSGACEMAIAGGVNVILTPALTLSFSKAGMLSEDGRCKTFDKGANGYVRGEGVGAIWLKSLQQAQADGDQIYAVIKGSAENHGGHAASLTAPNPNAQAQLLVSAFDDAQLDPSTISYIEAHGTGTSLGDPIEINGLKNAFAELYEKAGKPLPKLPHCGLGSVKTNIGHLEAAAGIAGIFKVLLAMKHQTLPGLLHFSERNPYIDVQDSPFYFITENQTWTPLIDASGETIPRRAGVSSFGFGGANAHIILEEYPAISPSIASSENQLLLLSAKNDERLTIYAQQMFDFLEQYPNTPLVNLVYTLQVGRESMAERLAIVASSVDAVKDKLTQYLQQSIEQPTEIAAFYRGTVKTSKTHAGLLIEGEEGEAFLRIIINHKKLTKLAKLWVSGTEIDWQLLYGKQKPQRISLPTYPFAKERYWIATAPRPVSSLTHRGLSPLIDQVDFKHSLDQGIFFQKMLSPTDLIIKDHRVGETPMLPGAAYLEMAYVAGRLVKGDAHFKLARVRWQQPLAVFDATQEIHTVIVDNDQQLTFRIQSRQGIHATGEFHPASIAIEQRVDVATIKGRCPQLIDKQTLYARFQDNSIHYGAYFQGVSQVWGNDFEALGQIELPVAFQHELSQYILHPTLMDCALQTIAGIGEGLIVSKGQPLLAFAVDEVEMLQPLSSRMYAYVKADGPQRFQVALLDETGLVCFKYHHLSLRALSYPVALPSLFETLVSQIKSPAIDTERWSHIDTVFNALTQFGQQLLVEAFQRMGVFRRAGEHYETAALSRQLNIIPAYARLYDALLAILQQAGFVERTDNALLTTEALSQAELQYDSKQLEQKKQDLIERYPEIAPHVRLLWVCLQGYPAILTGEQPATDIMFPDASMALVEAIYKDNPSADYFNRLVVDSVESYIQARLSLDTANEKIKILEIGAGTGGTSALVLKSIDKYREHVSYTYTDISLGFIQHGKQYYGQHYSFVDFGILNIEADVNAQGYALGDFDIIIAANVLHATRDLQHTLRNTKALLKAQGLLILNEVTNVQAFSTLTFGLLEGWWLFEDTTNRLKGSPLLSASTWEALLEKEGFQRVISLGQSRETGDSPQHIIIAESNGEGHVPHEVVTDVAMDKESSMVQPLATKPVSVNAKANVNTRIVNPEGDLPRPKAASKKADIRSFIEAKMIDDFASVLQLDRQAFDKDAPYTEFGVDSILSVEIIKRLNDKFAIELRTTDLFNYPTIRQLVDHIVAEFSHAIEAQQRVNAIAADGLFNEYPAVQLAQDKPQGQDNDDKEDGTLLHHDEMLNLLDKFKQGQLELAEAEQQLLRVL